MKNFSISLDLIKHGWAYITFTDDIKSQKYIVSYVGGDVMTKMIESAINLANGRNSEFKFFLEPEEISYNIELTDNNNFKLTIEDITFCDSVKSYIRQIIMMFDRYIYTYGKTEYSKEWYSEFPSKKLEILRAIFHTL